MQALMEPESLIFSVLLLSTTRVFNISSSRWHVQLWWADLLADAPEVGEGDKAGGGDLRGGHMSICGQPRGKARSGLALLSQPEGLPSQRQMGCHALQVVHAHKLAVAQLQLAVPV